MKAKDLERLMMNLELCEEPIDYVIIFREFLKDLDYEVDKFGINKIIFSIIQLLSKELNINETVNKSIHSDCGGVLSEFINVGNIIYDDELKVLEMSDYNFALFIQEPIFDVENMDIESEFINSISHLKFDDGLEVKLRDLNTLKKVTEDKSELDTFLSMIDMETFSNIMNLAKREVKLIRNFECDKCGFKDSDFTTDYIKAIHLILRDFLEG